MDGGSNGGLPGGWGLCAAGSGPGSRLYWRPDYNAPQRGFLLADGWGYVGVICEQGRNPFSKDGVLSSDAIAAGSVREAIGKLESSCDEAGYGIRG